VSKANSASSGISWVGLDVHKDSITSAVLAPGAEVPLVDRWFHDELSVRRFVTGLGRPARVRLCYGAGPTGYELAQTYSHYRSIVAGFDAHLSAVESDLKIYLERGPFTEPVARLSAYRGITELGALTLSAEVCDWRRFPRATSLMGFCGLVPSEYSSGERVHRGRITKAGNIHLRTQLVESAWSYQHRPAVGAQIKKRQQRCDPETIARAWAAQLQLCGKFRRLAERKSSRNIVVTAIARQLTGYLWAEMAA
jgi:transposase